MTSNLAVKALFKAIDAKDADAFVDFLTEDAVFRFGSQDAVNGRPAIREYVAQFFGMIQALSHRINVTWEKEDGVLCEGEVTYTKLDGSKVTLPFADAFHMKGDKVKDYLVYIDPAPLFS